MVFSFGFYIVFNNLLVTPLFQLFYGRPYFSIFGWVCRINSAGYLYSKAFIVELAFALIKLVLLPLVLFRLDNRFVLRHYIFLFLLFDVVSLLLFTFQNSATNQLLGIFFSNSYLFVLGPSLKLDYLVPVFYLAGCILITWLFLKKEGNKQKTFQTLCFGAASICIFYLLEENWRWAARLFF